MDTTASSTPDAIVVLGCPVRAGGRPGAAAERRARRAADAFHAGGVRLLIASGGRRWYGSAEADVLSARLVSLGVPREAIVRELCSLSTLENAAYSSEILRASGVSRPAIVTCDWHVARALACFAWMGIAATALAADSPRRTRTTALFNRGAERIRRFLDARAALDWTPS